MRMHRGDNWWARGRSKLGDTFGRNLKKIPQWESRPQTNWQLRNGTTKNQRQTRHSAVDQTPSMQYLSRDQTTIDIRHQLWSCSGLRIRNWSVQWVTSQLKYHRVVYNSSELWAGTINNTSKHQRFNRSISRIVKLVFTTLQGYELWIGKCACQQNHFCAISIKSPWRTQLAPSDGHKHRITEPLHQFAIYSEIDMYGVKAVITTRQPIKSSRTPNESSSWSTFH